MERTFAWRFSFDSLLDERAWEPGGVQTLVPTSGPQQSEKKTIIRASRWAGLGPRLGHTQDQCCPGRARMRGLQRGLLTSVTPRSACFPPSYFPVRGWMVSPQNYYAEPQPSAPQNETLFGNRVVADVINWSR